MACKHDFQEAPDGCTYCTKCWIGFFTDIFNRSWWKDAPRKPLATNPFQERGRA